MVAYAKLVRLGRCFHMMPIPLCVHGHRHLLGEKNKLDLAEKTIELHSPQRILKQGYSLTHVAGRVLTSADEVKPGDRLVTEFADGTITSIVE